MNKESLWVRFGLAVGFALAGWIAAPPALAQVAFTVNTASDDPDAIPGDGLCQTGAGACSLRAAIQESNAQLVGSDTINFSLALGGQVNLVLTVGGSGENLSATGDLDVTAGGISIQPQLGQTVTIQAGNAADGVFDVHPGGVLTLTNTTVVGPVAAVNPDSPTIRVSGGNLQLNATTVRGSSEGWGVEQLSGTSDLNNVTITGNALGGVSVVGGSATLVNATIEQSGVTGVSLTTGTLTVQNSIIANHGTDCVGAVTFLGNNIVETGGGSCVLTGTSQAEPQLGALGDNGGPTQTMAPAPTSPAVNGGPAACLATDQRGVSRPRGGLCDLGAYEYPVATIGTPAPLAVTDGQGTVSITATLVGGGVPFPVSIGYATANGTAVGGTDFVAVSGGVMTFAANTTTATAPITITRRTPYTGPLNFAVNYSTGAGGQVALMQAPTTLPVNIADSDLPPTVGFDPISISVNETTPTLAVTVTLSNASAFTTTVNYSTSGATAISGRDYTNTSGTLTFAPGATQATFSVVIINGTRYYGPGRVFNLNLSSPSAPATLRIGASATTASINEDDPPPNLTFSSSGFTVQEAAGTGVVTATLSTQADITITVTLATSDGTGPSAALAGRDYTALTTTVTFLPAETIRSTAISLINNGQYTLARNFQVALSSPVPAAVTGPPSNAQVTILDAQSEPTVGFDPVSISVNEITPTLQVTVTLSNASAFTTSVNYNTLSGTALPGRDYTGTSGPLTFTPGVTQTTFPVVILNNTSYYGPGRAFTIRLNSAVGAAFVPSTRTATVSINEDEPPPTLSFPNSGFTVQEAAGTGVVTATLSNPADITITVNLATSDGTGPSAALAGRDYAALNTALTFAPGETTRTTAVSLINNGQFTEARTFRVALSDPAPGPVGLGTPNDALVTILDAQSPPEVHYVVPSFAVNRTAGAVGITVTLNLTPTLLTTVAYTMSDGTAIAGIDYVPTSGTLTFNPGQTSAVITTTILNSGFYVGDRQFSVGLSTPSNATLGDPVLASVTIRDDNSRRVYLPIMSRSYDRFVESEPNNGISSATGPVISGATFFGRYTGSAPLDNDYWSFTTSRAGLVIVTLTNMHPASQVMLMTAGGARLGFAGGDPYTISVNVSAAGTYYVRVVTTPGQTSDYRLQIVYP